MLATSCSPPQSANQSQPAPADAIHVTGHGVDQASGICDGFTLTDAQAQQFFAKATAITPEQMHADYDYLPCWVDGTTTRGGARWTWRIRAGGTAEVTPPGGQMTFLGCKSCDDLFQ